MQYRPIAIATLVALLAGAAVYPLVSKKDASVAAQSNQAAPRPVVQVVPAAVRAMTRSVHLGGTLKSGSEANLSPKHGGKVLAVYVSEGQTVARGQTLVRLDVSDLQGQAERAQAGVNAARANWQKAIDARRLKAQDVERRIADARRGVEQAQLQVRKAEAGVRLQSRAGQADVDRAQAGVDAARSALAKAKAGARPEQRRAAEIQVRQAQRGVDTAKKNLDDVEYLFGKGGVPRIQLDDARDGYQKAQDGLAQAQAQLDGLNAGASPEDVAAAEAQVRSADATLSAAKTAANRKELDDADIAAAQGQLKQARDGLKTAIAGRAELEISDSDVRVARAAYDDALAAARLASEQVTAAAVTCPVDGIVTSVRTHAGEMAGPAQPLVTVVGTAGVYLEASVSARVLPQLRPGQPARITVDSFPGRTFDGTVRSVGSVAGPDGRSFPVQIDVAAPRGTLNPGAYARAAVTAETASDAVSVPIEALRTSPTGTKVWVVRSGRIEEVPVRSPVQTGRLAMIEGAVRAGDPVVISGGETLNPGDAVDTRSTSVER